MIGEYWTEKNKIPMQLHTTFRHQIHFITFL